MKRVPVVAVLVMGIVLALGIAQALAAYPDKPVTLVVPWNAGGVTDVAARGFASVLEKHLGQPVIVVNRPGASGAVGTEYVQSRPADGYTILWSAETPATFRVMGLSRLSFADFDPLVMMVDDPKVLVVGAKSPYKTMADLVADIKARPGKVRMAYSGPGASGHIQGLLLREAGLDIALIPFGSGGELTLAAINGTVEFSFPSTGLALSYLDSGDLRALAVWSDEPHDALPGVPPITQDVPELAKFMPLSFPQTLLIKKGTPPGVREKLMDAVNKALQDPQWIDFVTRMRYKTMHHYTGQAVLDYWSRWESVVSWLLYDAGVAKASPADFGIPRFK